MPNLANLTIFRSDDGSKDKFACQSQLQEDHKKTYAYLPRDSLSNLSNLQLPTVNVDLELEKSGVLAPRRKCAG